MKIGTIILCRYNSSRLPGKILKEIRGTSILSYLYEKLNKFVTHSDELVVATSIVNSDDIIETYCKTQGYNCYRGDLNNVADRFLQAAKAFNYDYVIRINGDAAFVDIPTYLEMIDICKKGNYDFVSNVKGRSFPFGMSIEIVKTSFYEAIQTEIQANPRYREHVTLYLYENPAIGRQFHHKNTTCPALQGLDVALDEPADFELYQQIFEKLKEDYYHCDLKQFHTIIESIQDEYQLAGKVWPFTHS